MGENVSAPTKVELDVTTNPEVEKQMLSLAPSKNEGIIVNVAPTQFGDCNLASKNVSAPTKLECGVNKNQMLSLAPSSKGVTIINMVSKQHRDYNSVSKNVSALTR